MTRARSTLRLGICVAALIPCVQAVAQAESLAKPLALTAAELKYESLANGPPGVLSAIPVGELYVPGIYVLRNKFPPNYRIPAHRHAEWRVMSVIEGTLYFAYGDTFDEKNLKPFGPGSLIVEPADTFHYFVTKDDGAVVQFVAQGPLTAEFSPSALAEAVPR